MADELTPEFIETVNQAALLNEVERLREHLRVIREVAVARDRMLNTIPRAKRGMSAADAAIVGFRIIRDRVAQALNEVQDEREDKSGV